jgi:hypothetical protein
MYTLPTTHQPENCATTCCLTTGSGFPCVACKVRRGLTHVKGFTLTHLTVFRTHQMQTSAHNSAHNSKKSHVQDRSDVSCQHGRRRATGLIMSMNKAVQQRQHKLCCTTAAPLAAQLPRPFLRLLQQLVCRHYWLEQAAHPHKGSAALPWSAVAPQSRPHCMRMWIPGAAAT